MSMLKDQELGFLQQGPSPLASNLVFPPMGIDHFTSHHFTQTPTSTIRDDAANLQTPRSTSNLWPWGDHQMMGNKRSSSYLGEHHHHIGVAAAMKMKKVNTRRKMREPRFCFKTMSDVDVLDDGYKWRKYGQKVVKNTQHPRSYYRCTQDSCRVKKKVERLAEDPRMVITTYEGRHAHSPSHDDPDYSQLPNSLTNNFFWSSSI